MSTRHRIQLGILAAVLAGVSIAGAVILAEVRSELTARIDEELRIGADAVESVGDVLSEDQLAELRSVAETTDRATATLVFDAQGEVALAVPSGTTEGDDPLPDVGSIGIGTLDDDGGRRGPFGVDSVDGSLRYRAIATTVGDGVVVLARPLDGVDEVVTSLTLTTLAVAGVTVVVLGLVVGWVTRAAIRPIDEMIESAEAIGDGDLSRRIETSSRDDEVGRLSDALNKMLHQLEVAFVDTEASENRLRRFVADASHELRTPLTSIRGYSDLYLQGITREPDDVALAMERINAETVRTGTLVEELLLLARLDQGHELASDPVVLSDLVADSVADARAVEPDRPISLEAPEEVTIPGDEAKLRQVMANLLANARSHTPPGSPVEVRVAKSGGGVTVTVTDHGPGMSNEEADRVFDRFWRAEPSRSRGSGGSGLGMAIVAAIVEAHHGTASVRSAPGDGTVITIELPGSG